MASKKNHSSPESLRERILEYFSILRVPLTIEHFDKVLGEADQKQLSHLDFLHSLLENLANERRERSIERRIKQARFRERASLEQFDWNFNKHAIDRVQFEELATADFIRRKNNVIMVGQAGIGKSTLIQALGVRACTTFSVRYATSAELMTDLSAALADRTLPLALRRYTRPDLLVIDEFGFDRIERLEYPNAPSLLYKVIDARCGRASTALVTNIDFDAWGSYLGDPPLAMALLDRMVNHAIVIKIKKARSFRAASALVKESATDK
jgi:DNA replication protein DnaC